MFLSLFVYLRFVSLSSTHGYFLRQENQNLNNIAFQQEVFKTQLLEQKQKNWTNLNSSRSIKKTVVTVDTQIVNVPAMTELSKNQLPDSFSGNIYYLVYRCLPITIYVYSSIKLFIYLSSQMIDIIFKTLSDKNRRRIIQLLKQKEMAVSELLTHFDITQASLSHHLDILKRSNLVIDERRGQFVYYSLNQSVFEETVNLILNLLV